MKKLFDEIFPCHRCLRIGVLNLMPSCDREATENMFKRRFAGFHLPVEIVWLHPEADQADFKNTDEKYHVPTGYIYDQIDYLFRTGADVEFVKPEDNRFLQCLRDSRSFDKGSTSLCWSAGQIYADDTGQDFSTLLIGYDEDGKARKRSGYYDYDMMADIGIPHQDVPHGAYMACSRHFKVNALTQIETARANKFQPIAISKIGNDIAGFVKDKDILLFTHNEYDPARLYYETDRCIRKASSESEKQKLRQKFPEYLSMGKVADQFGQSLFQAILKQAAEVKYPSRELEQPAPVHAIAS